MPSQRQGADLMAGESDIPQTWGAQLARAERILRGSGSPAPHQDAMNLLSYLVSIPVPALRALPMALMRQSEMRVYDGWVARRAGGEALARITGHVDFMGLDIAIAPDGPLA